MKKEIELVIPVGLPGSGKTFDCKKLFLSKKPDTCTYYDLDEVLAGNPNWHEKIYDIASKENPAGGLCVSSAIETIIVDGPWFTEKDVTAVIEAFVGLLNLRFVRYGKRVGKITIAHYDKNIEVCKMNDKHRGRRALATRTIETVNYLSDVGESLIDTLKNLSYADVVVEEHKVEYHWSVENILNDTVFNNRIERGDDDNKCLYSERWMVGGFYDGCPVDPKDFVDAEPKEFVEFDELLEQILPNITYLVYKKLFRACCKQVDETETDYYDGIKEYRRWCCDVNEVVKTLFGWGYPTGE